MTNKNGKGEGTKSIPGEGGGGGARGGMGGGCRGVQACGRKKITIQ